MDKRLGLSFLILVITIVTLTGTVSAVTDGLLNVDTAMIGIAVMAVIGIVMLVLRWTMTRLKKAGPGLRLHSVNVAIMITRIFAKTATYPIIKSMVSTSPQNLIRYSGATRNI